MISELYRYAIALGAWGSAASINAGCIILMASKSGRGAKLEGKAHGMVDGGIVLGMLCLLALLVG